MISTERTVRDALVGAIRGIAKLQLGFDAVEGNVRDYLLTDEVDEKRDAYLMTSCGGVLLCRAWGVQVVSSEEIVGANGVYRRTYQATVQAIYQHRSGSDVNMLIDHARAVRGAIKALDSRLGGIVDRTLEIGALSIDFGKAGSSSVLIGSMQYGFDKQSPDF